MFGTRTPTPAAIDRLEEATAAPGVLAHFATRPDESLDLAVLVSQADRWQRDDPEYVAEMAAWVGGSHTSDGIPLSSMPLIEGDEPRHTDIPLRDFDTGTPGTELVSGGVDEHPLIAVILTDSDGPAQRLVAGRAMMRLMIQAQIEGLASCPLSQSVDLLSFRTRLRARMSWIGYPQMMMRLGEAPSEDGPALTPRRPVTATLTVG